MKNISLQRDSLIKHLDEINNEKIKFISPDFGAKPLDDFRINNSNSFIYPGIAEQVSVDIAYGISLGNSLPILYGMSPFISARCFEQYKVLFGQTDRPICILPVGVGLGYDHNTLSHYSLDDIGIYASIPGLDIITPYDSETAISYLDKWINSPNQIVLRLERQAMPYNILEFEINLEKNESGVITKRNSKDLIVSWGYLGVQLLNKIKEKDIDIFIFDKISTQISSDIIKVFEKYENIFITEESFPNTGLASILLPSLINLNCNITCRNIDSSIAGLRAHRSTVWKNFDLDKI